jgi:hypothetical protein
MKIDGRTWFFCLRPKLATHFNTTKNAIYIMGISLTNTTRLVLPKCFYAQPTIITTTAQQPPNNHHSWRK